MKIVVVQFNFPDDLNRADYEILTAVFRESCRQVMPDVEFKEIKIEAPKTADDTNISFLSNTLKLSHWTAEIINAFPDSTIILSDADMLALKNPEFIFREDFDIAYTARTSGTIPLNGGIIFVKATDSSKDFFLRFEEINRRMYSDPAFHQEYRGRYRGMNQAAFGYLLENPHLYKAKIIAVPCREFNAVNPDWHLIDGNTCFVHFKSELRKYVLANYRPHGRYEKAMNAWYKVRQCIS